MNKIQIKNRLSFLNKKLQKAKKEVEILEEEEGFFTDDYSCLVPYEKVTEIQGRIKELKRLKKKSEK
jgi:hypothetical protein